MNAIRKCYQLFVKMYGGLLISLLVGCTAAPMADGQVLELGAGATARGLQLALSGAPNTHIITDGKLIFALWPQGGELWGGACINCAAKDPVGQFRYLTGGRGMAMTARTASEMVRYLIEDHGWASIPASAAMKMQPYAAIFARVSAGITSFAGFMWVPANIGLPEDVRL